MNLNAFLADYRESIGDILNQLQTVMLLSAQIDDKVVEIRQAIQTLNEKVEALDLDDDSSAS